MGPKQIIYSEKEKGIILEILEKRRNNGGFGTYRRQQLKEIHTSFCLTSKLYKRICKMARKEQKTSSEVVRHAIEFYCDLKEIDSKLK